MRKRRFPVLRLTTYHIEAVGAAILCAGVGLIWLPAGIIVAGIFLILAALIYSMTKERRL